MRDPNAVPVRMFFYGTLKRGEYNHAYCDGGRMVAEGRLDGSLYHRLEGYPAVVVAEEMVLAVGTRDYPGDARAAAAFDETIRRKPGEANIRGELYVFDDPAERLPILDRLEDFDPADPSSHYRRVLVPVRTNQDEPVPAWVYAARDPIGTHLPAGRWPA